MEIHSEQEGESPHKPVVYITVRKTDDKINILMTGSHKYLEGDGERLGEGVIRESQAEE